MKVNHWAIAILACSLCFVMGCSNKTGGSEFPPSITGLIVMNGKEYEMEKGDYQWERKNGTETETVQTDHASPYQMAGQIESISVTPNQKAEVKIEENPDITVYLWDEKGRGKEIDSPANQITLPSGKGKNIYEVLAEWADGSISYTFVVDVQ